MRAGTRGKDTGSPLPYCYRRYDDPFDPLDSPTAQPLPRNDRSLLSSVARRINQLLRRPTA